METTIEIILFILGGVGVFLFGIEMMGNSLKALAGNKMKALIQKTSNTPLKGILLGAFVTVVIQSSSGTTALTVSFVRSGLMSLTQATGIIMGANIGTTVTSFLVGLDIQEYALFFVGVGALMMFFVKKEKIKTYGSAILGFGLLFYGLELMSQGLGQVLTIYKEEATTVFQFFGDIPIIGALVGAVITAIVQSSSAAIAILQSLYGEGSFHLMGAIAILLGSNIGTTVTAMIASAGGSKESKQAAFIHFLFNVIGSVVFMILLKPYTGLMQLIEDNFLNPNSKMTISIAHMIFNLVSTFVMFFFINKLVALARKVIKDTDADNEDILLDESIIETSVILALEVAKNSIKQMARRCQKIYDISKEITFKYDEKLLEKAARYESDIDSLDKRLHDYLTLMIKHNPDAVTSTQISKCLDMIRDLERIGDHCTNIVQFSTENDSYTEQASEELNKMFAKVTKMLEITFASINELNKVELEEVFTLEQEVDDMQARYRKRHFIRINQKVCNTTSYAFVEILSDLERIADHCNNVSSNLFYEEYVSDEDEYS